ncbi:hypothetical protein HFO81_00820 [Rhizobium leguminosarum]|uniref:hypothetical protein n=1 Tax=Rhizobium leguminosarum TaxID=384 RepID=UPI001C93D0F9|nr:hypothetical protein [Rhizobium leguminosarum]MBY5504081.1 hypothetical protein [Rhizobium leguminosarum]
MKQGEELAGFDARSIRTGSMPFDSSFNAAHDLEVSYPAIQDRTGDESRRGEQARFQPFEGNKPLQAAKVFY